MLPFARVEWAYSRIERDVEEEFEESDEEGFEGVGSVFDTMKSDLGAALDLYFGPDAEADASGS